MIPVLLAVAFGVFLAFSNGANDNFKGVATLYGSGVTTKRRALLWATITTLAGSLAALFIAQGLLAAFSGRGLVPDSVVALKSFSLAVALAAAPTVFLATRLGLPVSTTHALIGSLVGAGWLAAPSHVDLSKLGMGFFAPLILSPVLALTGTLILYPLLSFARTRLKITRESCLCVGTEVVAVLPAGTSLQAALTSLSLPVLQTGTDPVCRERYSGQVLGIHAPQALGALHFLSAGAVSFARGLNDTPKIAAMLLAGGVLSSSFSITLTAVAIALGGLLLSGRIAETMAKGVTPMNPGQGFAANLVTGGIVIFASRLGLPVSTTHVSCGSLFGIGAVTRQAKLKSIASILLAWFTTLPSAAALAGIIFYLFQL